ncbi:MAG TPA: hypothetical protein VGH99_10260 [Pseudonocardia sp.]|jgi:hypothetical protein
MASPAAAYTAKNSGSLSTRDQARSTATVSTLPAVISPRAPRRPSQRPTGTATSPDTATPSAYAPFSSAADQPSSALIGTTNVEKAYTSTPHETSSVTLSPATTIQP